MSSARGRTYRASSGATRFLDWARQRGRASISRLGLVGTICVCQGKVKTNWVLIGRRVTARTFRRNEGREKAPVSLTGGGGFRSENSVAARLLLDLLGGTNSLGGDFGRVNRVDWQARDAGWLVDDLAITCKLTGTGDDRAAGLSIKSDRQVTAAGFPAAFARTLWEQWLGIGTSRALSRSTDAVVLVVGELAQNV